MAVGSVAAINAISLGNVSSRFNSRVCGVLIITWSLGLKTQKSYIWTRTCTVVWPFLIVISAIRAIIMTVELQRG